MTVHAPSGTVPAIDSAENVTGLQAVGNKADTEAGDSLIARTVVPLSDSLNNGYSSDVIGSKLDTVAGDSLYALSLQELAAIATVALDATAVNEASVLIAEAVSLGRDAEIEARKAQVATVIYSAILDGVVCSQCLEDDGAEVRPGTPEYYELMPPNRACESVASGTNYCRCLFVAVFEDEE